MKFGKIFIAALILLCYSCSTQPRNEMASHQNIVASNPNNRLPSSSNSPVMYKVTISSLNGLKCAAELALVLPEFFLLGARQVASLSADFVKSAYKKTIYIETTKCTAMSNKHILEGLITAGCFAPVTSNLVEEFKTSGQLNADEYQEWCSKDKNDWWKQSE
jgi:hypothetical protein